MEDNVCPICKSTATLLPNATPGSRYYYFITCPRCGSFRIYTQVASHFSNSGYSERQRAVASSKIAESSSNKFIERDDEGYLFNSPDIPVLGKCDKLLDYLDKKIKYVGDRLHINSKDLHLHASLWMLNENELLGILNILEDFGFLYRDSHISSSELILSITSKGWKRLDELRTVNTKNTQGFVAMWFDKSMNSIYTKCIAPAIQQAGYTPHRVDQKEHAGKIDDEIIRQIRRSRFIVADATKHRGGVYYEAGFAHGLGLKVFWACRDDCFNDLHFDIRQYNCIRWSKDNPEDYMKKLSARIEAELGKGPISTNL